MLALGTGVNIAAFGFFDIVVLKPLPIPEPHMVRRFMRAAPTSFSDTHAYPAVAFCRAHAKTMSGVLAVNVGRLGMDSTDRAISVHFVTANVFGDLGATPRLGRLLDPIADESPDATPAVVLDQRFWERQFDGDPSIVGRTVRLGGKPATIVGVAPNAFTGLSINRPDVWIPIAQHPYFVPGRPAGADVLTQVVVLVRTSRPPEQWLRPVASIARAVDPTLFPEVQPMTQAFNQKLRGSEYAAVSVSVLGGGALHSPVSASSVSWPTPWRCGRRR